MRTLLLASCFVLTRLFLGEEGKEGDRQRKEGFKFSGVSSYMDSNPMGADPTLMTYLI